MRRHLQPPPAEEHQARSQVERKRSGHRQDDRCKACVRIRGSALGHQGCGNHEVAGKKQPRGERPAVDAALRERHVGTRLLIGYVERKRIADRGARRREPLKLR